MTDIPLYAACRILHPVDLNLFSFHATVFPKPIKSKFLLGLI